MTQKPNYQNIYIVIVENTISNRKVSENKLSPMTRNKTEKKREIVRAKVSTYADVVKKGIEEKKWKMLTQ